MQSAVEQRPPGEWCCPQQAAEETRRCQEALHQGDRSLKASGARVTWIVEEGRRGEGTVRKAVEKDGSR